MRYTVIDMESNGLLHEVSTIYCLCYTILDNTGVEIESGNITDLQEMISFLEAQECIVGHNIVCYDIPVFVKIGQLKEDFKIIDTLALSYYLYSEEKKHGLGAWGEKLGVEKPKIEDWQNLTITEYVHRCTEDVKINVKLFIQQFTYLKQIYAGEEVWGIINYLSFKMQCLRKQEAVGIKLDEVLLKKTYYQLEYIITEKVTQLAKSMPKVIDKERPKVFLKKDNSLSVKGVEWTKKLIELNLPMDTEAIYVDGNPNSSDQLKSWLFSLGWEPQTFKPNTKKEEIPQVSLPFGQGLCPSVKDLYEVCPDLVNLEGLYIATHRLGLLKSYENSQINGRVVSGAAGFTNTLRMQHRRPIANLPGVDKPFGTEIRGCLTVDNDFQIMIGTDLSALEDSTKQHFIYFFDPDYVNDMRIPGFDPHLDIAVLSSLLSKENSEFYKKIDALKDEDKKLLSSEDKNEFKRVKKLRNTAKVTNFSATYGAGPAKIAKTANISLSEGKKLHTIYWERNKAINNTVKNVIIKEVDNQKWLFNPISKFWYYLKAEKDAFSTLNQGSGAYVFDTFLNEIYTGIKDLNGVEVVLQYHDEALLVSPKIYEEKVKEIIKEANKNMNLRLNLNVPIGCSIEVGFNYADCH